jgi:hypothetical protein
MPIFMDAAQVIVRTYTLILLTAYMDVMMHMYDFHCNLGLRWLRSSGVEYIGLE